MKYKDFEGTIKELVTIKLDEIERVEKVKILHAVESGSRAWGFASPDSDYDVRFIYVRQNDFYLKLEDVKDVMDWELNETLDVNGWDIKKVLQLFCKSNATLFEWAKSPIVYRTTKEWENVYDSVKGYFSKKAAMYHYYSTAYGNFHKFLQEDSVKYKKYFYVIRPLLACKWIDEKNGPPPVLFDTLKEEMLDCNKKREVNELLKMKVEMKESDKGKRLDGMNRYIEDVLTYYKETIPKMEDDRNREWEVLNQVFLNLLKTRNKRIPN